MSTIISLTFDLFHHDYIDHLDLKDLVNAFASQNDRRHCLENFDVAVDL